MLPVLKCLLLHLVASAFMWQQKAIICSISVTFTLSPHLFKCPFFDGSSMSRFSYSDSYVY